MYRINRKAGTCEKKHLSEGFHPLAVPKDATLVGQFVLGSSSVPGEGVLVNTWAGKLQMRKGTGISEKQQHSHVHMSSVTLTPLACPVFPVVGFNM